MIMGFVNEKGEKMPYTEYRTIDYDRNIILKHGGHGRGHSGRPPRPEPDEPIIEYFILFGDDFQLRFEGHLSGEDAPEGGRDLNWHIHRTWDAEGVQEREEKIATILAEAITAYGVYFGKKNVHSITVDFDEKCLHFKSISPIEPMMTLE
jgi:hypothetical protein